MQQARTSLLAAHSGSQFLATQAALLQGAHPAHPASVFLNNSLQQKVSFTIHPAFRAVAFIYIFMKYLGNRKHNLNLLLYFTEN